MAAEDFSTPRTATTSQKTDIEGVLDLFRGPLSASMHDRHAIAIDRLCRNNSTGFAIRDLPIVQEILELSLALAHDGKEEFVGPVCKIFGILSMPFQRRTSTDEYKMLSYITDLLACIGRVFTSDAHTDIQLCALEMLREFATANGRRPIVAPTSKTPLITSTPFARQYHMNQGSVSRSTLVPNLVVGISSALQNSINDVIAGLVLLILDISYTRDNCDQLVDAGLLHLFPKLFKTEACQPLTLEIVSLLWNVMENTSQGINLSRAPQGTLTFYPAEEESEHCKLLAVQLADALMELWSTLLKTGYKSDDKELRNEVLIVVSLLAKDEIFQAALHERGFVSLGLDALRCGLGEGGAFKSMAVNTPDLNFELTCLLCKAITDVCRRDECLKEALDGGLLHLLLLPLRGFPINTTATWNADQQAWILRQSLHCLSSLVPRCSGKFIELGGVEAVVGFIQDTQDEELMLIAISIIHMSAKSDRNIRKAFGDAHAMEPLMEAYGGATAHGEARVGAALAIAAICTGSQANLDRFMEAGGISMLVSQFQEAKENDPTMASAILVATCNLVWAAVTPHGPNFARFLVGGGPEAILDVMEVGHSCHQPVLLSLLSDLLQNPRAHKFMLEWRSTVTGRSVAEFLIEIWREQEDAKGISNKGVLVNTARPITGEGKRKKWIAEDSFVYGMLHEDRRKDIELLQGMMDPDKIMTKLFGIIKLMGFSTFHYLNARDKATMTLIENYMKFRQGEVWQDIREGFERDGMKPTAPDRERLSSGIESAEHIAEEVQRSQKGLILHHEEKLQVQESLFYTNMLLQKKADAEARFFQKDSSQLTMKERLEAKLKKEEMLRNSIRAAQSEYCNAEYSRQTSSDVEG